MSDSLPVVPPSGDDFHVDLHVEDGRTTAVVAGDVDLWTVRALRQALADVRPGQTLVLDLRGVTFIDSSGLVLLVEHRAALAKRGDRLELLTNETVERALALVGLSGGFD